jgi:hypothetical protein
VTGDDKISLSEQNAVLLAHKGSRIKEEIGILSAELEQLKISVSM